MKSRSRPPASAPSSKDACSTGTPQLASLPISQQEIKQIAQFLQQLPQKEKESWSIREAIAYLILPITTALTKGYSREEIAAIIRTAGIPISDASLKYQLSQVILQNASTAAANAAPTQRLSTKTAVLFPNTASMSQSDDDASHLSTTISPHPPRDTVADVISYLISDT